MNTLIRSALAALVLATASAAMAAPVRNNDLIDSAKPAAAYDLNSPQGARAFWDNQARHGN